jgi:hypothetical protein
LLTRLKANGEDFPMEIFGQAGLQVIEGQNRPAHGDASRRAVSD